MSQDIFNLDKIDLTFSQKTAYSDNIKESKNSEEDINKYQLAKINDNAKFTDIAYNDSLSSLFDKNILELDNPVQFNLKIKLLLEICKLITSINQNDSQLPLYPNQAIEKIEYYQNRFQKEVRIKGLDIIFIPDILREQMISHIYFDIDTKTYCVLEIMITKLFEKLIEFICENETKNNSNIIETIIKQFLSFRLTLAEKLMHDIKYNNIHNMHIINELSLSLLNIFAKIIHKFQETIPSFNKFMIILKDFDVKPFFQTLSINFLFKCDEINEDEVAIKKSRLIELFDKPSIDISDNIIDKIVYKNIKLSHINIIQNIKKLMVDYLTLSTTNSCLKNEEYSSFEDIAEGVICLLEIIVSNKCNQELKNDMFSLKNSELLKMIKDFINLNQSLRYYQRILRVLFKGFIPKRELTEDHEMLKTLWDSIQVNSLLTIDHAIIYLLALIEFTVYSFKTNLSINQISSFLLPSELLIRLNKQIKLLIERGDSLFKHFFEKKVIENLMNLVIEWPIEYFELHKLGLQKILTIIYTYTKEDFMGLFIKNQDLMSKIFKQLLIPQKDVLFFQFFEHLYTKLLFEKDNDYRKIMLRNISIYFNLKSRYISDEYGLEYFQKTVIFFLRILKELICSQTPNDFQDFFEKGINLDSIKIEDISIIQKNPIIQNEILDRQEIYPTIAQALENPLQIIQSIEQLFDLKLLTRLNTTIIGLHFIAFTLCLIHFPNGVPSIFRDSHMYTRFYQILCKIHATKNFSSNEVTKILSGVLNVATNNDYFYIVEKKLYNKEYTDIQNICVQLLKKQREIKKCLKYIRININFLIELAIKIILDWESLKIQQKCFYLMVLYKIVKKSSSNAIICGKDQIVNTLLNQLKKQKDNELKKWISKILISLMKISANPSQIKDLINVMKYNQQEDIDNYVQSLKDAFNILRNALITMSQQPIPNFFQNQFKIQLNSKESGFIPFLKLNLYNQHNLISKLRYEDNQNFINFSGYNSGIRKSDIDLSFKGVSIIFSFRIENMITNDIQNIYQYYRENLSSSSNDHEEYKVLTSRKSFVIQLNKSPYMKHNYFLENDQNGSTNQLLDKKEKLIDNDKEQRPYKPRIFSITGKDYIIELMVNNGSENKKQLIIEAQKIKSKEKTIQLFEFYPKEHKWYNVVLTFSHKSSLKLYLNGEPISNIYQVSIPETDNSKFSVVIGASFNEATSRFENSLIGQIKNFQIVKHELNANDIFNYENWIKKLSKMQTNIEIPLIEGDITKTLFSTKKELIPIDVFLNNQTVVNLIGMMTSIKSWNAYTVLNDKNCKQLIHSIKDAANNRKDDILYEGVALMEKNRFEDVFFSVGNLEIFYYLIENISILKELKNDIAQDILYQIILILLQTLECQNKNDALNYLDTKEGLTILAYLLKDFINIHGANMQFLKKLLDLINPIQDLEFLCKAVTKILLNFEIWKKCDIELKTKWLNLVFDHLNSIPGLLERLKDPKLSYNLLINLSNLHRGLNSKEEKILKERVVFHMSKIILRYINDEILNYESSCILGFLSTFKFDYNLEDYLDLIINLFTIKDKDTESEIISKNKLLSSSFSRQIINCINGFIVEDDDMEIEIRDDIALDHIDIIRAKFLKILKIVLFQSEYSQLKTTFNDNSISNRQVTDAQKIQIKIFHRFFSTIKTYTYLGLAGLMDPLKKIKGYSELAENSRNVYSLLLSLLIKNYSNMIPIAKNQFVIDIYDIMQRNFSNWQVLRDAKNSTSFILSFFNDDKDHNNIRELEYIEYQLVYNYLKYLLIFDDTNQILFYLLNDNDSKYFISIIKILEGIFKEPEKLPDISIQSNTKNFPLFKNIYQICGILDHFIVSNKNRIKNEQKNDWLCSLLMSLIKLLKDKKAFIGSNFPLINSLMMINPEELKGKFSRGNVGQNGGFLLLIIKIMFRYINYTKDSNTKMQFLNSIHEIFIDFRRNFFEHLPYLKAIFKNTESFIEIEKYMDDERIQIRNIVYIIEFAYYKFLKMLTKLIESNNVSKDISNDSFGNPHIAKIMKIMTCILNLSKDFNISSVKGSLQESRIDKSVFITEFENHNIGNQIKNEHSRSIDHEYYNFIDAYNKERSQSTESFRAIITNGDDNHKSFLSGDAPCFQQFIEIMIEGLDENPKKNASSGVENFSIERKHFEKLILISDKLKRPLSCLFSTSAIKIIKTMEKFNQFYIKFYFECLKVLIENKEIELNKKDFEIQNDETKIFNFIKIKQKTFLTWTQKIKEYNDSIKSTHENIKVLWNSVKKSLVGERGFWKNEERDWSLLKWKIHKIEDIYNRRMLLKIDPRAHEREYLNQTQYSEKYKNIRKLDESEITEISLSSLELKTSPNINASLSKPLSLTDNFTPDSLSSTIPNISAEYTPMIENIKEFTEAIFNNHRNNQSTLKKSNISVHLSNESNISITSIEEKKLSTILTEECQRITLEGAICGTLEISDGKLLYESYDTYIDKPSFEFGALKSAIIFPRKKQRKLWDLSSIKEIFSRNYNLIRCGFEIFTNKGKSYFFILESSIKLDSIFTKLKKAYKGLKICDDRPEEFKRADYQKKWVMGEISNFEYLMILNKFSSRSFNDPNQYPVFPWIISDYTSRELDMYTEDPEKQKRIFRDLSQPIGALKEKKREDAIEKYQNDLGEPHFHYGSHYSCAGIIINYLIRLEPFTSMNMDLQSGRFDQPDRLFSSILTSWDSCVNVYGDFRELIPEFFYFPEFLKNKNKVDFGETQNKKKVESVELPYWASTPEEFIYRHSEALECEYVSKNLNNWIDLIFGYKQRGQEAANAINTFRHLTYEGNVNLEKIKDKKDRQAILEQIFHLGQTPTQLFTKKHPEKRVFYLPNKIYNIALRNSVPLENRASLIKRDSSFIVRSNTTRFEDLNHSVLSKASDANSISKNSEALEKMSFLHKFDGYTPIVIYCDGRTIRIIFDDKTLYSIPFSCDQIIPYFSWTKLKPKSSITNLGKLIFNELNPKTQFCFFSLANIPNSPIFLIAAGYFDNSFKIYKDTTLIQSINFHKKMVTTVGFYTSLINKNDKNVENLIIVGSKDCRISIWKFDIFQKSPISNKEVAILYGHHSEIITIHIQSSMGLIASADKHGVILLHSILTKTLIRCFYPKTHVNESIAMLQIDEQGLMVISTTRSRIVVCTINEQSLCEFGSRLFDINHFMFMTKTKPIILFSNKNGELLIFDLLSMKEVSNLLKKIIYENKSDIFKTSMEIQNPLMGQSITHFVPIEAPDITCPQLLCAFENGSLAILSSSHNVSKFMIQLVGYSKFNKLCLIDNFIGSVQLFE